MIGDFPLFYVSFSSLPANTYIGLSDEAQEGSFRWLNNAPLHYEWWKSGQPTANTGKNCVVVKDGKWDKRTCSDELPFLCSSPGLCTVINVQYHYSDFIYVKLVFFGFQFLLFRSY